jgi:MFS transporter, FSR family, fosmidomycin resistance protein
MSISLSAERGERRRIAEGTAFSIILALGFSHFLNDTMQSLLPALYPMLKGAYGLSFAQIGMITLTSQLISSVLQPAVGMFADHRPQPYSLAVGMGVTFIGLLLLASAGSYPMLVFAAAMVGVGSAIFHPEASRVARMASGGRHGLAQSLFQVGGNVGSSLGPVLAAFIVIPRMVFRGGAARDGGAIRGRQLVPARARYAAAIGGPVHGPAARTVAASDRLVDRDPAGGDLF